MSEDLKPEQAEEAAIPEAAKPEIIIPVTEFTAAAPVAAEEAPVRQGGRDYGPGRNAGGMGDRKKFFYTKKVCRVLHPPDRRKND